MSTLSPQSEKYLKRFRALIQLYPRKHQQEYADAMVQLLRDQLEDAERLGDAHIRREVFVHAVLGIPGSLAKEYSELLVHGTVRALWEEGGMSRWRTTTYLFLFFLALGELITLLRLDSLVWQSIVIVAGGGAALTLLIFVFLDTRRLFLSFLLLVAGVGTELVAGTIVSGLNLHTLNAGESLPPSGLPSFSFLFLAPLIVAYLLAALFHAHPARFRRVDISRLDGEELKAFQLRITARRLRNKRIAWGILGIFLLMNVIGLYDPPVSHADLDLPNRSIPDEQNMVKELISLPIPSDSEQSQQAKNEQLYLSDTWHADQATSLLAGKEEVLSTILRAAEKPFFQDPGFADLTVYKTADAAVSAPIAQLTGLRTGVTLALIQAEAFRRAGNLDGSLTYTLAVVHIGDAMQVSHATLIGNLVGNEIRKEGLTELKKILSSSLSAEQQARVQRGLAGLHPTKEGVAAALKAEYYLQRVVVENMRLGGASVFFYPPPHFSLYNVPALVPFFFQPNRTVAGISDRLRSQLAYLDQPCAGQVIPEAQMPDGFPLEIGLKTLQFNGIGKQFIAFSYPYTSVLKSRCTNDAQVDQLLQLDF